MLYRNSLTNNSNNNKLHFLPGILFPLLLKFVKCVFPMTAILRYSLVFTPHLHPHPTPPPIRKNKLTIVMFLESFLICWNHVACDRLFVVGDLNIHFVNPSDPCTAALNVALGNLSLEQLVNVPTHRSGHTLDWLITNRATDVPDLTVADMLLSDHFVISFDLLLRKPGRATKKVMSRNISDILICMLL